MRLKIDQLNAIQTEYPAIDFEEYFSVLEIPKEDKEKRIELAEEVKDVYDWLFNLILLFMATGEEIDTEYLILSVQYRLSDLENVNVKYVSEHIVRFARETVETTVLYREDNYYLSPQRSSEIAAGEAHTYFNYEELQEAWENGYTHKRWNTRHDTRVRKTHAAVDGKTIPIDDLFLVGGSEMMVPRDTENGAELSEISGCRCWVTFS